MTGNQLATVTQAEIRRTVKRAAKYADQEIGRAHV